MVEISGRHTGDLIGELIFETIQKYAIASKLGWITTDNASTNVTALQKLSHLLAEHEIEFDYKERHVRCMNHVINLVVQDIVKTITVKKKKKEPVQPEKITATANWIISPVKIRSNKATRISEIEKDAEIVIHRKGPENGHKSLKKLRKLRSSSYLFTQFEKKCKASSMGSSKINLDCVTRWSSTYFMIEKALLLSLQLNQLCLEEKELKNLALNVEDWNRLSSLRDFLKLFKDCDKFMQREDYCNSSHVIPTYSFLFRAMSDVELCDNSNEENGNNESLWDACMNGTSKLEKYYNLTILTPAIALSTILSPNQKKQFLQENGWNENEIEDLIEMLKKWIKRYGKFHDVEPLRASSPKKKESFLLRYNPKNPAQTELERFYAEPLVSFTEECDALSYWKLRANDYPILHRIAIDLLSIPGSGSIIEKKFSAATNLTADTHRNRLDSKSISMILLLNEWKRKIIK